MKIPNERLRQNITKEMSALYEFYGRSVTVKDLINNHKSLYNNIILEYGDLTEWERSIRMEMLNNNQALEQEVKVVSEQDCEKIKDLQEYYQVITHLQDYYNNHQILMSDKVANETKVITSTGKQISLKALIVRVFNSLTKALLAAGFIPTRAVNLDAEDCKNIVRLKTRELGVIPSKKQVGVNDYIVKYFESYENLIEILLPELKAICQESNFNENVTTINSLIPNDMPLENTLEHDAGFRNSDNSAQGVYLGQPNMNAGMGMFNNNLDMPSFPQEENTLGMINPFNIPIENILTQVHISKNQINKGIIIDTEYTHNGDCIVKIKTK